MKKANINAARKVWKNGAWAISVTYKSGVERTYALSKLPQTVRNTLIADGCLSMLDETEIPNLEAASGEPKRFVVGGQASSKNHFFPLFLTPCVVDKVTRCYAWVTDETGQGFRGWICKDDNGNEYIIVTTTVYTDTITHTIYAA